MVSPKKVVYLWGAGATQGEAQYLGATTSLLMADTKHLGAGVTTRILDRVGHNLHAAYGGGDIEKIISLLVTSGLDRHTALADQLRRAYFEELRDSLSAVGVIEFPNLAVQLLEMHNDRTYQERAEVLSGVVSTNHDGLLQIASQVVFGAVNVGFDFDSEYFAPSSDVRLPPILQVHGSFTWAFGVPTRIEPLLAASSYVSDTVWIPPTTTKESKAYPFNKLFAKAYELLSRNCDVLRVVGASLTQNDWNILALIFNAQRHREEVEGTAFQIELIMPHDVGERISNECGYLRNLVPIGFLTDGDFEDYKDPNIPTSGDRANPFQYWLEQKREFHQGRGDFDGVDAPSILPQTAEVV